MKFVIVLFAIPGCGYNGPIKDEALPVMTGLIEASERQDAIGIKQGCRQLLTVVSSKDEAGAVAVEIRKRNSIAGIQDLSESKMRDMGSAIYEACAAFTKQ
jgi:hypothetical protein